MQQLADLAAGAFGGEVCIYGQNCGLNCEHSSYDKNDLLDEACYVHDKCLRKASKRKSKKSQAKKKCACDDALIATANDIASMDEESDMVRTAATVRDGIIYLGKAIHGCYF